MLTANETETILFLDHLQNEEVANHVSAVFQDAAYRLRSPQCIASIEKVIERFPDLVLVPMVNVAKEVMEGIEDASRTRVAASVHRLIRCASRFGVAEY